MREAPDPNRESPTVEWQYNGRAGGERHADLSKNNITYSEYR
jgi:hypothetical protein